MRVGQTVSSTLPPAARQKPPPVLRDPFNSTPTTAPVLLAPHPGVIQERGTVDPLDIPTTAAVAFDRTPGPPVVHDVAEHPGGAPIEPAGPGPMELQLAAELDAMQMINPTARTQSLLALQLARAADRADPGDVKTMLAVGKELRALLESLNKVPAASGGDDDDDDHPFGSVRPEIQHPAAV